VKRSRSIGADPFLPDPRILAGSRAVADGAVGQWHGAGV